MKRSNTDTVDSSSALPTKYRVFMPTTETVVSNLPAVARKSLGCQQFSYSIFNFNMQGEVNTASVTLPSVLFTWVLQCCDLDITSRLVSIYSANRYTTLENKDIDYFCIDRVKLKNNTIRKDMESVCQISETVRLFDMPGFVIFSTNQNIVIIFSPRLNMPSRSHILIIDRHTMRMEMYSLFKTPEFRKNCLFLCIFPKFHVLYDHHY